MGTTLPTSDVGGEVIWWGNTETDVSHAVPLVFGRLVRLAASVIKRYESDLFHDAQWLRKHMTGRSFTFVWSVGESGTGIGADEAEVTRAAEILQHSVLVRVTVELDERNRTVLTVREG
jgi:hypothetical protein